jgi:hypothetical protein
VSAKTGTDVVINFFYGEKFRFWLKILQPIFCKKTDCCIGLQEERHLGRILVYVMQSPKIDTYLTTSLHFYSIII